MHSPLICKLNSKCTLACLLLIHFLIRKLPTLPAVRSGPFTVSNFPSGSNSAYASPFCMPHLHCYEFSKTRQVNVGTRGLSGPLSAIKAEIFLRIEIKWSVLHYSASKIFCQDHINPTNCITHFNWNPFQHCFPLLFRMINFQSTSTCNSIFYSHTSYSNRFFTYVSYC